MSKINIANQVILLKENENNPKAFFKQLEAIFRDKTLESVFEEYIKNKKIDIFEMAYKAIKEDWDIFSICSILEKLAKYSIYQLDSLKLLFFQINELMKNDMALVKQYWITAEIVKQDSGFGESFLSSLLENGENWSFGHASTIYVILFEKNQEEIFDKLIELLNSNKINHQIIAVQAIGKIDCNHFNQKQFEIIYDNLEKLQHLNHIDLDIEIIHALKFLIKCLPKFQRMIVEYSKYNNENIQFQLSHLLFMVCKENSNEKWFVDVLFTLTNTSSKFVGIINNLRMIFNLLLEDEKKIDIVIDFILAWLGNSNISDNKKELDEFAKFILPKFPGKLVTLGLNHDNYKINKVMQIFIMHDTVLDVNIMMDFNEDDYIYVLRRIIGHVIGFEEQIQLIFSMLKVNTLSDNIQNNIEYVIINYIYKDYPIDTIDYLKKIS